DGTVDSTFNPGANGWVSALTVQVDGRIVVGGGFNMLGGQPPDHLGKLEPNGSLDPNFDPGVSGGDFGAGTFVSALVTQRDGRILVGGNLSTLGGQTRQSLGRLHPDGSVDMDFNPGSDVIMNTLAVQADDKILVGGSFNVLGGANRSNLGRLYPDGSLDATFIPGNFLFAATAVCVQPDGKILVGGDFVTPGEYARTNLARFHSDGRPDSTFSSEANPVGGSPVARAVTLQTDGKIVVAGRFTNLGGRSQSSIGRLNADGSLDSSFGATLTNSAGADVLGLAIQQNGRILVGGDFDAIGWVARTNIARLDNNGDVDLGFDPGANNMVRCFAVQSEGMILVGGWFTILGGKVRHGIGRLHE